VKRFGIAAALLVGFVLVCVLAIRFSTSERSATEIASAAAIAPTDSAQPLPEYPRVVQEDHGRIEIVRPFKAPELPETIAEPLFEAGERLKLGEEAKLQFAAHDRASGKPISGATVTASITGPGGAKATLPAEEVEDGVFEVPFTPRGPGRFQIALNVDGVQVGSRNVGVVGAVGSHSQEVDVGEPLSVDPRSRRARTGGGFRRR
jgi:YtkA-like